jgi:hypothetical protein
MWAPNYCGVLHGPQGFFAVLALPALWTHSARLRLRESLFHYLDLWLVVRIFDLTRPPPEPDHQELELTKADKWSSR